ncbi:MAG: hypothetical protein ACR2G2_13860 [Pseudonocardia sp.]
MRPVLAAVAAMVVLGIGVFTVVTVFRTPTEADPEPQLTPAGSFTISKLPPSEVLAPATAQPMPAESPERSAPTNSGSNRPSGDSDQHSTPKPHVRAPANPERRLTPGAGVRQQPGGGIGQQPGAGGAQRPGAGGAQQRLAPSEKQDARTAPDAPGQTDAQPSDSPSARPETPTERNSRTRGDGGGPFCERYHIDSERCQSTPFGW